jgi:hypothetical protein
MQALEYTALERLRVAVTVDRLTWLEAAAKDRIVLDLGAYDETAVELKRGTDSWLHARLGRSAREVIGVDNSEKLPAGGLVTGPNSKILRGDVYRLSELAEASRADVIMACELIEHLPDAGRFLRSVKESPGFAGKTLIVTTPNAVAAHNAVMGVFGRESQHHDHLQIFSFKTLHTLFRRAGFEEFELIPYRASFTEMLLRSRGVTRPVTWLFERGVNFVESRFPLLSAGWIVKAKI